MKIFLFGLANLNIEDNNQIFMYVQQYIIMSNNILSNLRKGGGPLSGRRAEAPWSERRAEALCQGEGRRPLGQREGRRPLGQREGRRAFAREKGGGPLSERALIHFTFLSNEGPSLETLDLFL